MCGDLEEEGSSSLEEALYGRFFGHALTLQGQAKKRASAARGDVNGSLDRLFSDALNRAMGDLNGISDGEKYRLLAAQPLVFARLAGFLAAHASLHEDPLRKVIEALMHGYAEAERTEPYHGHDHDDHDHGHGHGHDHHHHHGHDHHH
jgi:hypothetical protein